MWTATDRRILDGDLSGLMPPVIPGRPDYPPDRRIDSGRPRSRASIAGELALIVGAVTTVMVGVSAIVYGVCSL
jgi:hypothetical protein